MVVCVFMNMWVKKSKREKKRKRRTDETKPSRRG